MGTTNIVLAGVGGQGIITAAKILGKAAVKEKINVFVSEVHGIAQRGGAVVCTVRMGNISGPLIPNSAADAILSTEPIEALRNIQFANKKTKVLTDINPVIPFTATAGEEKYPDLDDVFNEIKSFAELYKIDASKIAKEAGDVIAKNIVMLGALTATDILPIKPGILLETIIDSLPVNYRKINKRAFEGGIKTIKK